MLTPRQEPIVRSRAALWDPPALNVGCGNDVLELVVLVMLLADVPFMGAFRCARKLLVDHPMPTSPPFVEDVLWERKLKALGVTFVGVHVPAVHVDSHTIWHGWRRLIYLAISPERSPGWKESAGLTWRVAFVARNLINQVAWDLVFRWIPRGQEVRADAGVYDA